MNNWRVAMGSPLSPIVANFFMKSFETKHSAQLQDPQVYG